MSTSLTTSVAMPTPSKPLGLLLIDANIWMSRFIQNAMHARGYTLNPAEFAFLANLDCGETHASSVARRMGISRQAVYRITRELSARHLLGLVDDPEKGNQKIIAMTDAGKDFVMIARACLAEAEAEIAGKIGAENLNALQSALSAPWGDLAGNAPPSLSGK